MKQHFGEKIVKLANCISISDIACHPRVPQHGYQKLNSLNSFSALTFKKNVGQLVRRIDIPNERIIKGAIHITRMRRRTGLDDEMYLRYLRAEDITCHYLTYFPQKIEKF